MVRGNFKSTEVGIIPIDWEVSKLLDKCLLLNGLTYTPANIQQHGLLVLRSSNIQNGKLCFDDNVYVDCHISDEKLVRKNDIIVCVRNGSSALIGKCAIATEDLNATFGAFMALLRGEENEYVFQLLQEGSIQKKLKNNSGATINQITKKDFESVLIPAPPADEQKTIATALSDVDELIANLEKLIEKKKAIKQGVMQELLTGKKRLPGFSGEWKSYEVGTLGDFYQGLSGKTKESFWAGNSKYIPFMNVLYNTIIDTSYLDSVDIKPGEKQNEVRVGDLFFNTSSETPEEVGMCAVLLEALEDTYLNSFCFGFRLKENKHSGLFISYLFNSSVGRKIMYLLAQGATRYNLSKSNFAKTKIILPEKEEQEAIAGILLDIDAEISTLNEKLEKYQNIKQGMMQKLLTGEIRLV